MLRYEPLFFSRKTGVRSSIYPVFCPLFPLAERGAGVRGQKQKEMLLCNDTLFFSRKK
jgi:hypothetical protein